MKSLKLFLIIAVLLFVSIGNASAKSLKVNKKSDEVLYEAKEIKNLDKLRERALAGKTDEKKIKFKTILTNKNNKNTKNKKEIQPKTYETTQKIKAVKKKDGTIQESMVTTVFVDIPTDSISNNKIKKETSNLGFLNSLYKSISSFFTETKAYAASQSDDYSGSSYSVRSYSTIYWDKKTSGGINYVRLTRVSGGWSILDSSVSISNRKVEYGQTPFTNVRDSQTTSSNTFNYYTPSTWGWENDGSGVVLGSTTYVTIKRGTSSWVQKLTNNYNN